MSKGMKQIKSLVTYLLIYSSSDSATYIRLYAYGLRYSNIILSIACLTESL